MWLFARVVHGYLVRFLSCNVEIKTIEQPYISFHFMALKIFRLLRFLDIASLAAF